MPLFFLFVCLSAFVHAAIAQSIPLPRPVYIYGKIDAAQSPLISIDIPKNLLTGDVESYAARIAPDGTFAIYCPLMKAGTANLFHNNHFLTLFLFPGDSISIHASGEQLRETIKCSGKGGERNQFLCEYNRLYESNIAEIAETEAMKNKDAGEYRYHADQQRQKKLQLLASSFKNAPETAFFTFIEAKVAAEWANNLFDYPMIHALKNNLTSSDLIPGYYQFLDDPAMRLNNSNALLLPRYGELMKKIITQKIRPISTAKGYNNSQYYSDRHALSKQWFDNKPLYFFQAQNIIDALMYDKPDNIDKVYREFIENCPYSELSETLSIEYEKAAQLMNGKPAPNFALTDANGKQISLSSLRGKAVYIDFWASWCAPCRAEMPHSKQLYERLSQKPVEFVYISIDENPEAWLKAIETLGLKQGKQLISMGLKSDAAQAYNLKGVPRYIIVDTKGNIADSNAKRPSEPNIDADILKAILP